MNNVSEYAVPTAWTTIVLSIITGICVVVNIVMSRLNEKEMAYIEKDLVKVTMRYPSTFSDRDIWVPKEDIEKYTKMNLGLQEAYKEIEKAVNDSN